MLAMLSRCFYWQSSFGALLFNNQVHAALWAIAWRWRANLRVHWADIKLLRLLGINFVIVVFGIRWGVATATGMVV